MRFPLTRNLNVANATSPFSLFDKFFSEFFTDRDVLATSTIVPPVNIAETDSALRLELELPGVEEKDIDVEIQGNQLVVKAKREFHDEKAEFHAVEHRYGSIARRILLPRGLETDAIEASFRNGVLSIEVPKSEPETARKIEIRSE